MIYYIVQNWIIIFVIILEENFHIFHNRFDHFFFFLFNFCIYNIMHYFVLIFINIFLKSRYDAELWYFNFLDRIISLFIIQN